MTVFGNSNAGYLVGNGKQVFPVDYEAEVSQRLVDAAHNDDTKSALELIADPFVDVNFIGTVSLKAKKTEIVLRGELAHQVRVEYEEFKTEVTALFLAAHSGNLTLVRKLLSLGANVNQKLFRGYATTAAVREGHLQVLQVLIDSGASQEACEEALFEASHLGMARAAEILMASDMIRSRAAVRSLVSASCRGFADVVDALLKCGVDANATDRLLLQSSKPTLHTNVNCYALVAAIVSRQTDVVRLLLQSGVRTDIKVKLGAWSWDMDTGEDFRVGAGLAEAYSVTWCAVEYYEASGAILSMLLEHVSCNVPHFGRTLIHHVIICNNARAVDVLLNCGADVEAPIKTSTSKTELRPIHLAARLGLGNILQRLVDAGCNVDSRTGYKETALMICARHKHKECLRILASAGADFGLVNPGGQCAGSIAESARWSLGFQRAVLDVIRDGKVSKSSNMSIFSPLMFVARANDVEAMKKLVEREQIDLDEQDENGFTAAMIAAAGGHLEAFKLLVNAGANVKLQSKFGQTAMRLSELNQNSNEFEKVMLEHALQTKHDSPIRLYSLHRAASKGELDSIKMLLGGVCDINAIDDDGYTALMLAASKGHAKVCELLISFGANCDVVNQRQETALILARKNGIGNDAEQVILDEIARKIVVDSARLKKHTKCGKGAPHNKTLRMVAAAGVLRWGKSSKRNVICKAAETGPSEKLRWNRRRKFDTDEPGMFHVVTTKNKEVHFVCEGGFEMAQMWVRGIKIVTRDAIFGKKTLVRNDI